VRIEERQSDTNHLTVLGSVMQFVLQRDEDQYPTELIQFPKNSHVPKAISQQPIEATLLTTTAAQISVTSHVLMEAGRFREIPFLSTFQLT
jgi:hypothetical protein